FRQNRDEFSCCGGHGLWNHGSLDPVMSSAARAEHRDARASRDIPRECVHSMLLLGVLPTKRALIPHSRENSLKRHVSTENPRDLSTRPHPAERDLGSLKMTRSWDLDFGPG